MSAAAHLGTVASMRTLDYTALPPEALMRARDILPVLPYGRSVWYREVAAGRAPQPVMRGRVTAWRWGDVRRYLRRLAGDRDDATPDVRSARRTAPFG